MNFLDYIRYNDSSKTLHEEFSMSNNQSFIISLELDEIFRDNCIEWRILRNFDVLNKLVFVIYKNSEQPDKILRDISQDILRVELLIGGKVYLQFPIQTQHIMYDNDQLCVLHFNLSNCVSYDSNNVGGVPLTLYDFSHIKCLMWLKNKTNKNQCKINLHTGGFCLPIFWLKNKNNKHVHNLNKNFEISKLVYDDSVILHPYSKKILNYLNIARWKFIFKKTYECTHMIYELIDFETETTHIVLKIPNEILSEFKFIIRINGYDVFDEIDKYDKFALYFEGYFIFKLNSKISPNSIVKIMTRYEKNITDECEKKLYDVMIYNIYDVCDLLE